MPPAFSNIDSPYSAAIATAEDVASQVSSGHPSDDLQPKQPARVINPKALFVTNLSPDTDFVDLHKHFDRFGTTVLCRVLKDAKTGISRGIGYVNFDLEDAAAAAQAATDGLPGPRGEAALSVKFAEQDPTYKAVATPKVFVRYVPVELTPDAVAAVFSRYGTVTSVNIDADRSRAVKKGPAPWNYAYVEFATIEQANEAIAKGAREVQWGSRPITVKPAEGDETRRLRCSKDKTMPTTVSSATVATLETAPAPANAAAPSQSKPSVIAPPSYQQSTQPNLPSAGDMVMAAPYPYAFLPATPFPYGAGAPMMQFVQLVPMAPALGGPNGSWMAPVQPPAFVPAPYPMLFETHNSPFATVPVTA